MGHTRPTTAARPTTLRNIGALAVILATLIGLLVVQAQSASASVTGGCQGTADFASDGVGAYGPDNDTRSNPIVVPKAQGDSVHWTGSVPGDNRDFGGEVGIYIGPAFIIVADWGLPNHDGSNVDDERSDEGDYNMEEFWAEIPGGRNIAQGIYAASANHTSGGGVDCVADFFVKFGGNPLSSPLVIALLILLVLLVVLLFLAGRRRAATGRGRLVMAIIVAFLLALVIALLLQQFSIWPLDNLTVIVLPILMIILGVLIARMAPFGGAPRPSTSTSDF